MEYVVAKGVVERIGIDLALKLVSGLTASAQSIYGLIGFIQSDDTQSELAEILESTDVEMTIRILETFVKEIHLDEDTPNTVIQCLKSVKKVLKQIEGELIILHNRIKYNKSLWVLKSVRSYGFTNNMIRIKRHLQVLESRKKLLFEMITVSGALSKNTEGVISKKNSKGKKPKRLELSMMTDSWIDAGDPDHPVEMNKLKLGQSMMTVSEVDPGIENETVLKLSKVEDG